MHRTSLAICVVSVLSVLLVWSRMQTALAFPTAQGGPPPGTLIDHPCTNCANSVAATDDAVWAGTSQAGLIRWDRATGAMTRYTEADGLVGTAVRRLAAEASGRVWAAMRERSLFGDYGGLSVYDGGTWTNYPAASLVITGDPTAMVADPHGGVWLSNALAAGRFDGSTWLVPRATDGMPRTGQLATDRSGGVWLASEQTIYRLEGDVWTPHLDIATAFPEGSADALLVLSDDELFVALDKRGTYDALGLARFDHGTWHLYTTADGLARDAVVDLAIDGSGTVWAAHGPTHDHPLQSLSRFDGQGWQALSTASTPALPGDGVSDLAVAPDGAVAVSSSTGGVGMHTASGWTAWRDPSMPASMIPFALGVAPDGALWVGFAFMNDAKVVQRRAGGRWTAWSLSDGFPALSGGLGAQQAALSVAPNGTVYVGLWMDGVLVYDGAAWHTITTADGLPSDRVRDVLVAPDGRLWVATDMGLARRDGTTWTVYGIADGLPSDDVLTLAATSDGDVWAGTASGAARWDGLRWSPFTEADGLPGNQVKTIAASPDGSVWFGTDAGLAQLEHGQLRTRTGRDGVPDGSVWALSVDPLGRAWAALTSRSLPDEFLGLLVLDGPAWQWLSAADGVFYDPRTSLFDFAFTPDGHTWIATLHGLQEFVPDPLIPLPTPTPSPIPQPTPTTPTDGSFPSCTCPAAARRLPAAVLADALANPAAYAGWGQRVSPSLPPSPANPLRTCLDLTNPGTPFHPTFNGPVWRGGCR